MTCAACGSIEFAPRFSASDRLYHTTDKRFQVVSCSGCGLLRLFPQPSLEELRGFYPDKYWHQSDGTAAGRLEELYRRVVLRDHVHFVETALRQSGSAGPVLDVGCGGGLFLRLLKRRGFPVLGLDLSPSAARLAWEQNRVPAVCGLLDAVPFAAESCGAITMFHVLEHLPDPRVYLDSARRLLRPEGRLIVQVPNAACWQFRLLGSSWNGVDVPRHLFDFRACDLDRLLTVCGFEVLRRKHFSVRDNPAGLASSLAPALDPMARRVRRIPESGAAKLIKDLVYFGILLLGLPFTLAEAACGAGSTVMVEARRRE